MAQIKRGQLPVANEILAFFKGGNRTTPEVAQHIGCSRETAARYVNDMRAEGLIHVAEWRKDSIGRTGSTVRVYGLGNAPDAPKPTPRYILDAERVAKERAATEAAKKLAEERRLRRAGILPAHETAKAAMQAPSIVSLMLGV